MISVSDYFKQFRGHKEITEECKKKAAVLIAKVSHLLSMANVEKPVITSGFRTQSYNKQIGGSANSTHCYGEGIDLWDPDYAIGKWAQANQRYLIEHGLYFESLSITNKSDQPSGRWVHAQIKRPRSGNVFFIP